MTLLHRLFSGTTAEAFRRHIFTKHALHADGELQRLGLGEATTLLRPPGIFAASHMSRITAYVKGREGETRHTMVPPDVAPALYESGATIEVPDVADFFEPVARFARDLAAELGELPGHSVAIATPPGVEALPMHFDSHDVFVVQIAGSKQWTVAPSDAPAFPMHSFSPTLRGAQRDGDSWQSYFPERFPSAMPAGAQRFVLRPGSVAYVPAGHWHATSSTEGSVSLTVAISPPRFLELFVKAVVAHLLDDAEMRQPLPGTRGHARGERSVDVQRLLLRAQALVSELSPEALLPMGTTTRWQRTEEAQLGVVVARGQRELVLRLGNGAERPLAVVDQGADAFVSWFNGLGDPVSSAQIVDALTRSTSIDPWTTLARLESAGALRSAAIQ